MAMGIGAKPQDIRGFETRSQLDFIQLRSIAERFSEAFQQYAWDF